MRAQALRFCLLAALAALAFAQSNYSCPTSCDQQQDCHCGSWKIPGGLSASDTPLFIVLTNDDAITEVTQPVILNVTERHQNHNGCPMPATWFVSINFTDPTLVQEVFIKGHEIATHTIHHVAAPDVEEIVGARTWLNETAHIPLEKLQGFRTPFLAFDPQQREILYQNGFRYDSTISESYSSSSKTSPNPQELLWPYTFNYGIPQDCAISTGTCTANESYPGLWEFPMWLVQDTSGNAVASMDPQGNNYDQYKLEFDQRYAGNRAPLGIFIHAAWLIAVPEHVDELNQFIEYALSHEGVFLATISQVLDWIENPVPASQLNISCLTPTELAAELPGGMLCTEPSAGCEYGTFNSTTCICACQNEDVNAAGYCPDSTGSCTVQKGYNFTTDTYSCPDTLPSTTDGSTLPSTTDGSLQALPSPSSSSSGSSSSSSSDSGSSGSSSSNSSSSGSSSSLGTPQCGHELVPFQALAVSGTGDTSELYTQALKAIDGSCDSCAQVATGTSGAYLTITLYAPTTLTAVSILSSSDQPAIDIHVGNDTSNNGLNNPTCAAGVTVPGNQATNVTCAATGTIVTLSSSGGMTLCDAYPISSSGVLPNTTTASAVTTATPSTTTATPNTTQQTVVIELDISGVTVNDFQNTEGGMDNQLCSAIVKMTGDSTATCAVVSVTANSRRRHLLESGVHVDAEVNTTSPQTVVAAFSSGSSVSSALQPGGFSIDPTTVKAYTLSASGAAPAAAPTSAASSSSTSAPASSASTSTSSGGSSVPVAAIAGGVVGGLAVVAAVVAAVVIMRRRKAAAAARADWSTAPLTVAPFQGVSVSFTTGASPDKVKPILAPEVEDPQPLGAAISGSLHQQQ